jgi:hypothetical protein
MDTLSLLYEKQNLPGTTIRNDILNQIRIAEAHNNTTRISELATVLNDAEISVLITEGIWDGIKNVGAGIANAASGSVQRFKEGQAVQQKKNFVLQLKKLYQPAVEMAKKIIPIASNDQQFSTVTNALAQFMSAIGTYEQSLGAPTTQPPAPVQSPPQQPTQRTPPPMPVPAQQPVQTTPTARRKSRSAP